MSNSPETFAHEGLVITVTRSNGKVTLQWKGVSDRRTPGEFLNPWTERVVDRLKGVSVVVDLRALEYMNSSTVAPLIKMVKGLDGNASEVEVIFDVDSDWQQTHMRCMKSIARTLHHVSISAAPLG